MSGQHSAKGTTQHSIARSVKNKRTGKYDRQRHRTDGRKARVAQRDTCKLRRLDSRCQEDADAIRENRADGMQVKRDTKRRTRERLRRMSTKDRAEARRKGLRQFNKLDLTSKA